MCLQDILFVYVDTKKCMCTEKIFVYINKLCLYVRNNFYMQKFSYMRIEYLCVYAQFYLYVGTQRHKRCYI